MIRTFADKETEQIWKGTLVHSLPFEIQNIARRKLRIINNSLDLNDLRVPPANRLEKLKGDLHGMYSIRINRQWRIVFQWLNCDAYEVEIIDYH